MNSTSRLVSRFASNAPRTFGLVPLDEDQMRAVAPSIFAEGKHCSRSARYTYIPTIEVLRGLRKEGFEPFMVAQSASRQEEKRAFTKHMIRLRHAGEGNARDEANEVILINSHDGASSYQMLAGVFRFVCCNGLVIGDQVADIRVPHKGDVRGEVIDGAFQVLEQFAAVNGSVDAMKALQLSAPEQVALATAAIELRFPALGEVLAAAPIAPEQLLEARRSEDGDASLWTTFQRIQENALRGGQPGRTPLGRRMNTRPVQSIDRSIGLNRALWTLAEEMRRLKC
jgi:hypothetical protein